MNKTIQSFFLLFVGLLSIVQAQEISDTKFGKGMINFIAKDSSFSVKFAPRIQSRFQSQWDYNEEEYDDAELNFLVRRARLKFGGFAFTPKLKYKIELGLSNRDLSGASVYNRNTPRYILDAVVMWNFHENFELWAGQTKLPGNIERVVSSANLQLIDRSLLNSKFNIDRDMGIQLRHKTKLGGNWISREKFSISQGEGRNITEGNIGGLQYTSRLELLPFGEFSSKGDYSQGDLKREKSIKAMFGFTYDINNNAVKNRSNMGSYMTQSNGGLFETDITTVFIDGVIKYNGFSLTGEYASRNADTIEALEADGRTKTGAVVGAGSAINFQGSYLFKNNVEMTLRYTNVDFKEVTRLSDLQQITYGISKYVVGHSLKIQADLSFSQSSSMRDFVLFRTGFDLHF
ncbi:porin [Flavobacteriaceae bacterium]|nr:OprO/OprP family phosphate-selective porin [bacterium]MDB4159767.1 OprO/OprP family phosphate-selective porin [Flavobacteriaceae bacterium]MDC3367119.1 OprO/OprP family phosphate-selective porin [Flavobacteriaceae bacterium]MDC6469225.1 porin [Flavobacteriaceae bacterium]